MQKSEKGHHSRHGKHLCLLEAHLELRKKATRGSQKAIVAVAHALLTTVFHVVRNGVPYKELGANYHKLQNRELVLKRRVRELASLGYEVAVVRDFHKPTQDSAAA